MPAEKKRIELLSPAANLEVAIAAVNAGADAVYMGGPAFGARVKAGNSMADVEKAVVYAHRFGARVFLTLNTLLYEHEIPAALELYRQAADMGVDAVLLQDLRLLDALPSGGLELHASTQCHIDSVEKALYLESLGFKRLVLARELSLAEIAAIKRALRPETEIETFIHGALCVCYSGQCYMSEYLNGRSGNRGDCAQSCRLPYDLLNARGEVLLRSKHLLSMKDLNADAYLEDLVNLGVDCLKIEGRLKDADYVKNVTLYYRRRLDKILSNRSDYEPASLGRVQAGFEPDLDKTFHREYCSFNLSGERTDWAVFETPKATGERVGRIKRTVSYNPGVYSGVCIEVEPAPGVAFTPGDGLCFLDADARLQGFNLERVENLKQGAVRLYGKVERTSVRSIKVERASARSNKTNLDPYMNGLKSVLLYRNRNIAFERQLQAAAFTRTLPVYASFDTATHTFTLKVERTSVRSSKVERTLVRSNKTKQTSARSSNPPVEAKVTLPPDQFQPAKNPAAARENFEKQLGKLGGTCYHLAAFEYKGDEALFLPASVLNAVRRELVDKVERTSVRPSAKRWRSQSRTDFSPFNQSRTDFSPFIQSRTDFSPFKTTGKKSNPKRLMLCKHCIRAQLRQCLKRDKLRPEYQGDLFIRTANHKFALKFDCAACRMEVHISK